MKHHRKFITRVIVFLLLGVVVNIAICFACSMWMQRLPVISSAVMEANLQAPIWRRYEEAGWPQPPDSWTHTRTLNGYTQESAIITRWHGATMHAMQWSIGSQEPPFENGEIVQPSPPIILRHWRVNDISVGWPVAAFRGGQSLRRTDGLVVPTTEKRLIGAMEFNAGVLRTNAFVPPGTPDIRLIPYIPLWSGLAINSLFYAAMLRTILAAFLKLRRSLRIKRGLCPQCAYPIGKSEVCTECGAVLTRKAVSA